MNPVLGIDFGTSNSAAAVLLPDGRVSVLEGATGTQWGAGGERTKAFPSFVLYDDNGTVAAVGAAAKAQTANRPDRLVHSVKPLLGKTYLRALEAAELARLQVPVQPDAETGRCLFEIGERGIRPQEVCATILRHIRETAEASTGILFNDVVLSVPAYHDGDQLAALLESAHLAGFGGRVDIVREPAAAALAMDMPITPRPVRVLVVDLGGGTLDVSASQLCRSAPGPSGLQCDSLGNTGDNVLGGLGFDDRLYEHLRHVFGCGLLTDEDRGRLRRATEAAKIQLSTVHSITVAVLLDGREHSHLLRRAEFEAVLRGGGRDLLAAIGDQLRAALAMARWRPEDVDLVALVGGPTAMPCVRQVAREIFYRNAAALRQIDAADAINPMTAVAVGAARFRAAETVNRHPFGYGYVAVTATSTGKQGIVRIRREAVTLIESNTAFPSPLRTEIAQLAQYRGDKVIGIEIIQRMPESDTESRDIGPYRFLGLRHLAVDDDRFGVAIEIGARLNENGELELSLTNLLDGRSITYVGAGSARRHVIELPTTRLESHLPRHGDWVFVPDYAGGVKHWGEALQARLQAAGRLARPDRHLAQALDALGNAIGPSPSKVGAERQANDLYLAGRTVLARAQELRLIDEPEAATLEAALEAARRACWRYDEVELDPTEA